MTDIKNKRSILLSIKPFYATKIIKFIKNIEVRRKIGHRFIPGANVIIYASAPMSKIIGSATIDRVVEKKTSELSDPELTSACLSRKDIAHYTSGVNSCYLIYLNNVNSRYENITITDLRILKI
ncbi:hypothetical protein Q4R49_20330, partial [Morganella morganii subsp. sibonii]